MKWIFIVVFAATGHIQAAQIQRIPHEADYAILVSGYIQKGDTDQIKSIIEAEINLPRGIFIGSPGGEINEAIKMGRFLNSAMIPTWTAWKCHSACFLALMGSPHRRITPTATIGIHRPYYDDRFLSRVAPEHTEEMYSLLLDKVTSYLEEMGANEELINMMVITSSKQMKQLTRNEIDKLVPEYKPYYEEWLIASCGKVLSGSSDQVLECRKSKVLLARSRLHSEIFNSLAKN